MSVPETTRETPIVGRPVQASWWQQFWWRYSPHGELPLSSVASCAVHAFVALMALIATIAMAARGHEPPRVDVVSLGDGNSTGPAGGGDSMPTGGDGEARFTVETQRLAPVDDAPTRPEVEIELPTLPSNEPPKPKLTLSADPDSSRQMQETDAAFREAGGMLRKILEANQSRGGGKGTAEGPGTGQGVGVGSATGPGSGRGSLDANSTPGRQARWIVTYPTLPQGEYERMLDSFHIELAYLESDRKTLQYLSNFAGAPKKHSGDAVTEERMFWYWMGDNRLRELDDSIMRMHGLAATSEVIQIYSRELEQRLAEMEREYLRKQWKSSNVERIAQTNFKIMPGGLTGWHIEVSSLTLR